MPELSAGMLRVALCYVPVNPSDLIPVTGAYIHRCTLPGIVGYEGVGRVVDAPTGFRHLIGQRVLPLRGEGTWQTKVDCLVSSAIKVPNEIPDLVAARAYINPLAALLMLRLWPVEGKTVLLTAAGSGCAEYLGRWALCQGARRVIGLYRSEMRLERLLRIGIEPIPLSDTAGICDAARRAGIAFDALGGDVASGILSHMQAGTDFVAYGLLTGKPVAIGPQTRAKYHRFHMRDHLPPLGHADMYTAFAKIWPRLSDAPPAAPAVFAAQDWRDALAGADRRGGRKSILDMTALG